MRIKTAQDASGDDPTGQTRFLAQVSAELRNVYMDASLVLAPPKAAVRRDARDGFGHRMGAKDKISGQLSFGVEEGMLTQPRSRRGKEAGPSAALQGVPLKFFSNLRAQIGLHSGLPRARGISCDDLGKHRGP